MVIQTVNGLNRAASFGLTNPIRNLGSLAITMFAVHIISNLPKAEASSELCKSLCEPLPGGENDPPEQICTKTCEKGGEIIETQTKEVLKNGQWKTVEVLGTAVKGGISLLECSAVCSPGALFNHAGRLGEFGLRYVWGDKVQAVAQGAMVAAKATCTAMIAIPYAGWGLCYSCCHAINYNAP